MGNLIHIIGSRPPQLRHPQEKKKLFDELDKDGTGFIGVPKIRDFVIRELGVTDEQAGFIVHQADSNTDHKMNYEEFNELLARFEQANSLVNEEAHQLLGNFLLCGCCCCLCTLGLSWIPLCCYHHDHQSKVNKKILEYKKD
mmetsp:Transcript_23926/g.38544  ORF Transcript_23926/g.38544 Transcript_23926/m.38544 type:complete len:142 (+) Transcript_23926:70-495(+)